MTAITLEKIAKAAGVSVSTVSKALTNNRDVSENTRILVEQTARELGYFTESKRRKLGSRRPTSLNIGILCPEIVSVHYSQTVSRLCRLIEERGGKASIFLTDFDAGKQQTLIERCVAESSIDGVIILDSCRGTEPTILPMVRLAETDSGYAVWSDVAGGITQAVGYLKEHGHQRIGFVGETLTVIKEQIFRHAMNAVGLPCREEFIFREEARFEAIGSRAAEKIAALSERPTALVAAYDEIAYGLMYTFHGMGIRVPGDISLIGINDIPTSRFLETPLTSLAVDYETVCGEALNMLLEQLNGTGTARQLSVRCRLVERSTVKTLQ